MNFFTGIYSLLETFINFFSFKKKFSYDKLNNETDDTAIDNYEISDNYETIIFNQMKENIHSDL
jgi:hypothetical protein